MLLGKVIGNVWATKKDERLNSLSLLVVEPYNAKTKECLLPIVAADLVGAGIGEDVLIVKGSSANYAAGDTKGITDAVIVGIVDGIDIK